MAIKTVKDLEIYNIAYQLALEVFELSKTFSVEEKKIRKYIYQTFNDAIGSSEETRGWLEFARDFKYIVVKFYKILDDRYDILNSKMHTLISNWKTF